MREKYESLSVSVLRDLAKARGIAKTSGMKKSELVEAMLRQDEIDASQKADTTQADAQRSGMQRPDAQRSDLQKSDTQRMDSPTPAERDGDYQDRQDRSRKERPARRQPDAQNAGRERPERTDRVDRTDRTERNERADRPERNDRIDRMERAERTDRVDRTGQTDRAERNDRAPSDEKSAGNSTQTNSAQANSAQAASHRPPADLASLDSGNSVTGILEILADGYGFLRSDNYLPGENDVYVAPSQIRKFNLKTGDIVTGNTRIKAQQEKYSALLYIRSINGMAPADALQRYQFEDMTPIFPNERLRMERGTGKDMAMRIVDLISPVGKGQRGMIVSPPKAGKTTLLKEMARSILKNQPDMHIIIMLIDERPEEVTDIREAIVGENVEVLYSTFDELPEHHKRVSEMGIERAKRLVEYGYDVTILLDSITRLARAYNLTVAPSGRTLSGGLDPAALHMPKRFFGAARKMREGGSLTILATALVDTGSKMDDVVYEEFKGTGNMELVLDRKLSERRVFPAIDIQKSGTRREDLLLDPQEMEAVYIMRRALNGLRSDEAVEKILDLFVHTRNNQELTDRVRRMRMI